MLPLRPLTPITALAGTLALLLLAPAGALPAGAAAPLPDWSALRPALYDLEAHLPGDPEPRSGIGFAVQGVDGIVTCLQFVQGAARVTARPVHGSPIEITEYVVHDPAADLILLQAPAGPTRLARGTFRLLALGQTVFAMLPPPAPQAAQPVQYFATFLASGAGELLGVAGGAPTGAVLVDSLGKVLGIVHVLSDGMTTASAAVPIERLFAMLASPETGGPLSALAGRQAPAWARGQAPESIQALGGALGRARRFAEAVPLLTRAAEQDPRPAAALLEWGMALQGQGQYEQAEALHRRALALEPRNSRAHLYLGSNLHMQGLYGKAEEVYLEAIGFDPGNAQLHVNLGGIYYLQKKSADAERAFRQALVLDPQMGNAHYNLGVLLATQGRRQEALAELEYLRAARSGLAGQLAKFTGR